MDNEEFSEGYLARLDAIGIEVFQRRFAEISTAHDGRGLVLSCFEPVGQFCHRHPVSVSVISRYHFRVGDEPDSEKLDPDAQTRPLLPQPSPLFWRQAWIKFQRALDPLAPPKSPPVRTQLDQETRERPTRPRVS